jgi:hypothetical protein
MKTMSGTSTNYQIKENGVINYKVHGCILHALATDEWTLPVNGFKTRSHAPATWNGPAQPCAKGNMP